MVNIIEKIQMESVITFLLANKFGVVTVVIGIAVFVTWRLASFYYKRYKPVEKSVRHFDEHSNCVGHRGDIDSLKDIVRNIERLMLKNDNTLIDKLSISRSPRQLSDTGADIYEASGAKALYEVSKLLFMERLDGRKPKTALDVEYEAHSTLLSMSDDDIFVHVKNFVYNNPHYKGINMSINTICFIISIVLRNDYLDKHTEIKQDE